MGITLQIRYDNLPQLSAAARSNAQLAVAKAAYDVEAEAKRVVPVDTGNLKNSIQTTPEGDLTRYVGPRAVEYAVYVEYGTGRRGDPSVPHSQQVAGMAARPYMRPAAEKVRPQFISAMEQIVEE